jgi:hypothetical protein
LVVAALALQCEHRRRLRVLGRVLDVINPDRITRRAQATTVPSGCSIPGSSSVMVAGFQHDEAASFCPVIGSTGATSNTFSSPVEATLI